MKFESMESYTARAIRNYAHLKSQGRCVSCSEKLPAGSKYVRCPDCRGKNHPKFGRYEARLSKFRTELERVIETAPTMTVQEQAADLGVHPDRIYCLRARARRDGYDLPSERGRNPTGKNGRESSRWYSLEGAQRCIRCGLRGEHVCLAGSALDRRPLEAR